MKVGSDPLASLMRNYLIRRNLTRNSLGTGECCPPDRRPQLLLDRGQPEAVNPHQVGAGLGILVDRPEAQPMRTGTHVNNAEFDGARRHDCR